MIGTAKKALSLTSRMARITATMLGLAVMLAAMLGVGTAALAAVPGDPFRLGQNNLVNNAITSLVGSRAGGAMMLVDNNSGAAGSRALDLRAEAGRAPLTVNPEAGKAPNLDADKLDGKDSAQFVRAGTPSMFAAGQIRSDGSIRGEVGAVSAATHPAIGIYCIAFSQPLDDINRLESAVVGLAGGQFEGRNFPRVTNGTGIATDCANDTLIIQVTDPAGNPQDGRFSFIVP